MRIERAHIFGFGIHADRAFTFGEGAPLTVCYGLNEAGKSTLLAFIRSILFGFPQRNQQKRYAPINGGEYGGYLVVIDETGKKYRIERTIAGNAAGKTSAGKLRIYDELLGTELPEQMLSQLTGGISAELYRNLFAFGLSELQELRTLQADEINSFLFSTGIGIPGGAINKAEKMLSQRLDELYKIRGAKQEINRQLKKIELLEHELRRSKELLGSYNIRVGELAEKKREIAAVQSRLAKADETKRWLEQCVAAAPNWRQLREVELELRQLPPIDSFPEQALPRFAAERAAEDKLLAEISRKRQQLSQLSEELAGIEPNSALIAAAPEIAKLAEELGVFKQSRSAVVQLAEEIRHISAELRDLLKQIDPAWTDGQLRNFSLAVGEKEALRQYRDQFALLQTDKADAEGALQAILAQLDDHARMVEEKRELIAQMRHTGHARGTSPPEPHKPEEVAAALAKLRQAFAEWKHMALQRDYLARRLSDLEMAAAAGEKRSRKAGTSGAFSRNLPRFIGVLLNVALPFVLYGYTHDVLVSAGAFLLLMLSQIVLWRGKPAKRQMAGHESTALVGLCQSAERELAAHEARMAQAEAQMRECVGTMMNGIGPAEDLADIAQTLSDGRMDAQLVGRMDLAMERWQEAFSELNRLERELAELARQESLLKAKKAQAAERIAAISERRDKLLTDWQDWLSGRNLAISLSVEAVEEIFGLAARAKQLMHMRESKQ
ncbi:MAG TPA: AAA family ATPase, partial [Bacilli bacterium]